MDETRYYFIAFRERPTVATMDEVTRAFDFPMVAAFVGYEGEDGLSYSGLTSSCDDTHFHTTAKVLNKEKSTKNNVDVKAAAEKCYNNGNKIKEGGTWDFVARPFADILKLFIETRQVANYPEDKKKLKSKLTECSNATSSQKKRESESNCDEEDEPDLFESQEVEIAQKTEDSTASLLKEINDLSVMEAWQMGGAEHEIFERLMKLAQRLETRMKTISVAERECNEDFAELVTYKVMKQLRGADVGQKATLEALKTSHDILSKQLKSAQTSIKTSFRSQQDKFASVGSKIDEVDEKIRITNIKLTREPRNEQITSQRYVLPNTPDSSSNNFSSRRSSGASSSNGCMQITLQPERQPRQTERPHLLPHPRNYDYSPPPRENLRRLEDSYQPKRARRNTPDHGHGAAEVFDEDLYHQPRLNGLR